MPAPVRLLRTALRARSLTTSANHFRTSTAQPIGVGSTCHGGRSSPSPFAAAVHHRRNFARSSGPSDETPEDKALTFVITVGHDRKVAQGVVAALSESGLTGEALLSTVRSMAGRWEVGEDEGLEALVSSVKQNLALTEGKDIVRVWCVPPNAWASGESEDSSDEEETEEAREAMMSRAFVVEAVEGTSLTDVAKFGEGEGASTLGEYLECACSGIMACSTCHVVVNPDWFEKVGEPVEAEQDMIDLAYSPRDTSRLGCQIVLTKNLEGMVIRLPKGIRLLHAVTYLFDGPGIVRFGGWGATVEPPSSNVEKQDEDFNGITLRVESGVAYGRMERLS